MLILQTTSQCLQTQEQLLHNLLIVVSFRPTVPMEIPHHIRECIPSLSLCCIHCCDKVCISDEHSYLRSIKYSCFFFLSLMLEMLNIDISEVLSTLNKGFDEFLHQTKLMCIG